VKWAFIYLLEADEPERTDTLGALVGVGVRDVSDAAAAACQLVSEGVELIELCGGFGGEGLAAVVQAVQGKVPVGAVFYGVDASAGLQRLFGAKASGYTPAAALSNRGTP
jgi:predicted polyphosphate/ATP-dependent NAD kinase